MPISPMKCQPPYGRHQLLSCTPFGSQLQAWLMLDGMYICPDDLPEGYRLFLAPHSSLTTR